MNFNYEKKIWGSLTASLSIVNVYCFPLKNTLSSLSEISGNVLDAGCGAGALILALKKLRPDLDLFGLDVSKKSIETASKRSTGINFIHGQVEHIPFKNNFFSAVIVHHLLEHLQNPDLAVKEIFRVLKPGGVFISSTPLEGNWSSLVGWLRSCRFFNNNRIKYLGHIQAYSKKNILEMFEKVGFTIHDICWSGFLSYQLVDALYYPIIQLLGKKPDYLAEISMGGSDKMGDRRLYTLLKGFMNLVSNTENVVLQKLPGFIINISAIKYKNAK